MARKNALMLIADKTTVALEGEWLEAFWCDQCQEKNWYHVCKITDRTYTVRIAPQALWQQVSGVIDPAGNQSVGEFTRQQARQTRFNGIKDFQRIG
jgi:hypothetical protein